MKDQDLLKVERLLSDLNDRLKALSDEFRAYKMKHDCLDHLGLTCKHGDGYFLDTSLRLHKENNFLYDEKQRLEDAIKKITDLSNKGWEERKELKEKLQARERVIMDLNGELRRHAWNHIESFSINTASVLRDFLIKDDCNKVTVGIFRQGMWVNRDTWEVIKNPVAWKAFDR